MDNRQYIQESLNFVNKVISTRDQIRESIKEKKRFRENLEWILSSLEEAQVIISTEITSIQKSLKEDINALVTIALRIVYEEREVSFHMSFDKNKAGQSQYKPFIIENDEKFSPKEDQCGGALDVISYALRIILHSFEKPKGRDFMIFDEPFKFLGGGVLAERAADMAKKINTDIGIQSLIISHDESSIGKADIVYHIDHNGRNSICSQIAGVPRRIS